MFQHKYHTKIDEQIEKTSFNMRSKLVGKLITVLEKTLGKLSAHDEGTMMGGFFNKLNKVTNVSGNGTDLGKSYIQFVRTNMDVIGKRVNDDLWVLSAMEVRINFVKVRSWNKDTRPKRELGWGEGELLLNLPPSHNISLQ